MASKKIIHCKFCDKLCDDEAQYADHIEKIEAVPETIITLTNGKKYIDMDKCEEKSQNNHC